MVTLLSPDRRGSDCNKWGRYPADVIPLWVADMDYAADPAIVQALQDRLTHPVLGYCGPGEKLREILVAAIRRDHGWRIEPDWLMFLPGVEPGFNMALHAFTQPGDGLLQELPVYKPLRASAGFWGLDLLGVDQIQRDGAWISDEPALATAAARARAHILCNPQNPTGRVYTQDELERRAELCLKHDLVLISDEIHCGLTLDGRAHLPIASLSPEIARRSITLMAASKTWNIAGLKAAFAIVPDASMRMQMLAAKSGLVDSVNIFGLAGTEAAYGCLDWRDAIRAQLAANRDLLARQLALRMPKARMIPAQASFLAWIDFTALELPLPAAEFFLHEARVALGAGNDFGIGLESWARLNFGAPPETLIEALDRMQAASAAVSRD